MRPGSLLIAVVNACARAAPGVVLSAMLGCYGAGRLEVGGPAVDPSQVSNVDIPPPPAFAVPRDRILLLPFRVRLAKVARVIGVPANDPILASLLAVRIDLGDYDF